MKNLFLTLSFLIIVSAFDENSLGDLESKAVDTAKNVVSEVKQHLPDSVKDLLPSEPPSIEEGEEFLKERCMRYGTNESFDNAMAGKEDVQFCLRRLVNYTQIQQEIEQAKPTGDLDTVFRQYCKKSPQLRGCVTNFTDSIEPCLSPEERNTKITITNITDALISFICFKEGDRIALFIAEEGPDCLKSKQDEIQGCINSTFHKYIPKEALASHDDIPLFKLSEAECRDVNDLQKCVVKHLETCSEPTPANIVDSMFTFVKKVTPCQQYEKSTGAGYMLSVSHIVLFVTSLIALRFPQH